MLFGSHNSPLRLTSTYFHYCLFDFLMANDPNEAPADDFLEQILGLPNFAPTETGLAGPDRGLAGATSATGAPMMLQLSSGDGAGHLGAIGGGASGAFHGQIFPLGLSLEHGKGGFLKPEEASGSGKRFRDEVVDGRASSVKNVFHGQPMQATVASAPHPPAIRPRVRARRGQPQIHTALLNGWQT